MSIHNNAYELIEMGKALMQHEMLTSWELPWTLEEPITIVIFDEEKLQTERIVKLNRVFRESYDNGVCVVVDTDAGEHLMDNVYIDSMQFISDKYNDAHDK